MKIENVLLNKEQNYVYMERYVNDGSPSGFDKINTTSEFTAPRSTCECFDLLVLKFDNDIKVETVGEDIGLIGENCVFCHPDNLQTDILKNLEGKFEIVSTVKVAPTASARSVKLLNSDYFLKLDYMKVLGRVSRNLSSNHLLSAREVSCGIVEGIQSGVYNPKFGILKENKGRVAYLPLKDGGVYQFGYLIREAIPFSRIKGEELFLIPGFSLFGKDFYAPQDKELALQLLEKSGKDVNDFAFNELLAPIVDCYFDALCNHGFMLEAHAQNTLIAIDKNFKIRLIVSRDMESVDKDLPLRDYLNVKTPIEVLEYKCIRESDYNYIIKHSFMYDFKLGEYLLNPLVELFNTVDGFKKQEIISKIKQKSQGYIKRLPKGYFPDAWYNYENKQFEPNERRPYISNENPKFR